jgi:SAM-dependent methyltransferase
MRLDALDLLACPVCRGSLEPLEPPRDGLLDEGTLSCRGCKGRYPVRRGIPVLALPGQAGEGAVARNFGYKWQQYPDFVHTYERRFLDNIHPLRASHFEGKRVLEACCGIGIPDFFIARAGAKHVLGFDVSESVFIAQERCAQQGNVEFVQADMAVFPFQQKFDVAVCLAALHHLPSPREGFERLVSAVVPGGTVVIWVYGKEGTRVVRHVVDPIRRFAATRCPLPILNAVSKVLAVLLWVLTHGVYCPLGRLPGLRRLARRLPLFGYLWYIQAWPLRQLCEMVFDQLLAPVTHYISRQELERWFDRNRFASVSITSLNGMSWRAHGVLQGKGRALS